MAPHDLAAGIGTSDDRLYLPAAAGGRTPGLTSGQGTDAGERAAAGIYQPEAEVSHRERVEVISRLFTRRASLWWALSRGEILKAARASARSRIADLRLSAHEHQAGRVARTHLGRAIREARARASAKPLDAPLASPVLTTARGSSWRLRLLALIAALLAFGILLRATDEGRSSAGATARGGAATEQTVAVVLSNVSRGRTISVPPLLVAEPLPTSTPVLRSDPPRVGGSVSSGAAPPAIAGTGSGGAGGPGAGGGGNGVTEPSSIPPTSAAPSGYVRFHGRVVDAFTGRGIPGMCLVIGSLDCAADKPHSDANGYWSVDLTMQPYWDVSFTGNALGYRTVVTRVYSSGRTDVLVPDIRVRPS